MDKNEINIVAFMWYAVVCTIYWIVGFLNGG